MIPEDVFSQGDNILNYFQSGERVFIDVNPSDDMLEVTSVETTLGPTLYSVDGGETYKHQAATAEFLGEWENDVHLTIKWPLHQALNQKAHDLDLLKRQVTLLLDLLPDNLPLGTEEDFGKVIVELGRLVEHPDYHLPF